MRKKDGVEVYKVSIAKSFLIPDSLGIHSILKLFMTRSSSSLSASTSFATIGLGFYEGHGVCITREEAICIGNYYKQNAIVLGTLNNLTEPILLV
jgi:hypothetical protein